MPRLVYRNHVVNQNGSINVNYGTKGGGAASQRLNLAPVFITGATNVFTAATYDKYNSLQAALTKRLSSDPSMKLAYTWSKDMQGGFPGTAILDPAYKELTVHALLRTELTTSF
ncbi:MAG: hypothetical protein ABI197_08135 [Granulicella sp.]